VDNKVEVLPDIMIVLLVELEALLCVPIKLLLINIANEADVLHILDGLRFLISQLGEGIDDDTENDVQQDCDDDHEE
jgi:hypothetical protein